MWFCQIKKDNDIYYGKNSKTYEINHNFKLKKNVNKRKDNTKNDQNNC